MDLSWNSSSASEPEDADGDIVPATDGPEFQQGLISWLVRQANSQPQQPQQPQQAETVPGSAQSGRDERLRLHEYGDALHAALFLRLNQDFLRLRPVFQEVGQELQNPSGDWTLDGPEDDTIPAVQAWIRNLPLEPRGLEEYLLTLSARPELVRVIYTPEVRDVFHKWFTRFQLLNPELAEPSEEGDEGVGSSEAPTHFPSSEASELEEDENGEQDQLLLS